MEEISFEVKEKDDWGEKKRSKKKEGMQEARRGE